MLGPAAQPLIRRAIVFNVQNRTQLVKTDILNYCQGPGCAAAVWAACAGDQFCLCTHTWVVRESRENPLRSFSWELGWSSGPCHLPGPPGLASVLLLLWLALVAVIQPSSSGTVGLGALVVRPLPR